MRFKIFESPIWRDAAFRACIILALNIFAAALAVSEPNHFAEQHRADGGTGAGTNQNKRPKPVGERIAAIWDRTFEDPVAFYTLVLSVFTGLLALVSGTQIVFFIRADKTARMTAAAALKSANAAVMVEIPKLVLTEIKLSAPAPELLENLRDPTAFTVFKNFGRTPAFLRYSSTNIFVGGRLPPEPDYFNTLTLGPDRIITEGGEYRPDRARIREPLQEQDVHAVMYGRKILWVYGYISYSDFLGELHVAKFCKQFAPPDGGVPNAAWFSGDTPEAYTESY